MKPTPLALVLGALCSCEPLYARETQPSPSQIPPLNLLQQPPSEPFINPLLDDPHNDSMLHTVGQAAANRIKNFGKFIARSSWHDDFNPAANRSPLLGQLADSKPHRFWYYRLQNSMTSSLPEDELVDPVLDGNLPEGPPPVLPKPQKPQISTYAALPTALFSVGENLRDQFIHDAQRAGSDGRPNLFISGYQVNEHYQGKANRYSSESHYYGWQIGARWMLAGDEQRQLALSLGVNKGQLSLVPDIRDGSSSSHIDTQSLNAMLSWQQPSGLQLAMPFGVSHYRGRISTDQADEVAQMKAIGGHVGLDGGWRWSLGAHAITPVAGITAQWLNIDDIHDQDGLHARYHQQTQRQFSGGVKYEFSPTDVVRLGMEARYVQRSGNAGSVRIGDEGRFTTARSGNSLRYSSYVDWQIADNVKLNTQLKMQQRLGQEGVSNLQAQIGVQIAF
jgi:serine protease autotransporter